MEADASSPEEATEDKEQFDEINDDTEELANLQLAVPVKIIQDEMVSFKEVLKNTPSEDAEKQMAELEALITNVQETIVDTKDKKKEAEAKTDVSVQY